MQGNGLHIIKSTLFLYVYVMSGAEHSHLLVTPELYLMMLLPLLL